MVATRSQPRNDMALRKRQKKISIKAFGCDVLLMLTDRLHLVEKQIHKKYKTMEKPCEDGEAEGVTISVGFDLYVMILDMKHISYNLVGHEVFHVVHRITQDREISDEETMAWLTGYLCEEVHGFINRSVGVSVNE